MIGEIWIRDRETEAFEDMRRNIPICFSYAVVLAGGWKQGNAGVLGGALSSDCLLSSIVLTCSSRDHGY